MDLRKLPNLGTLKAFEAAARLKSFSRAADELHVTNSAVSHQIPSLEADLGMALFRRDGKRVSLSDNVDVMLRRSGPHCSTLRQLPSRCG